MSKLRKLIDQHVWLAILDENLGFGVVVVAKFTNDQ